MILTLEETTLQGADYDGNLEEAVITYDFGGGFSVSAGKMLTYMGFEAFDPTNMYQYSYAYDFGNTAVQSIYDAYDVGVSLITELTITALEFGQVPKTVLVMS